MVLIGLVAGLILVGAVFAVLKGRGRDSKSAYTKLDIK
jgi:hypothetical protein